jgi:predicted naringenin-chalcone synthase
MKILIQGIGLAAPRHSIDRQNALGFAKTMLHEPDRHARSLEALYRMSSVQKRGSVLLEQEACSQVDVMEQTFYPPAECLLQRGPSTGHRNDRYAAEALPLGCQAALAALQDAEIDASDITHLVTVTCTGFSAPGFDIGLIDALPLSPETQRVQIGFMGCHGAINALRAARGLIAADYQAKVLIVCVELCSLHYQYGWETDRVVSNAIFADGAAALVLSDAGAEGSGSGVRAPELIATGSRLIADSQNAMTWRIGDHGFEMTLSAEVPGLIENELSGFLVKWLARHDLTLPAIGGWAVHPGGPRILRAVQSTLGLSTDHLSAAREVLANHGNMSSPTMLFILQRFFQENRPRPWLMLGFGPGLVVEVALIR